MKMEHIRELLQIMCHFNTSSITHTFTIDNSDETLIVKVIKDSYILEVTSSEKQNVEYFTSVDEAAERLYKTIHATNTS